MEMPSVSWLYSVSYLFIIICSMCTEYCFKLTWFCPCYIFLNSVFCIFKKKGRMLIPNKVLIWIMGFPGVASAKEPAYQCRRHKRCRFHPGWERYSGGRKGTPLQYSCLENPMDRRVWWSIVYRVAKSRTWLNMQLSTHAWIMVKIK